MSDSVASKTAFGARMTMCKCGHPAIEHYDSYLICLRSVGDEPTCDCEEFDPAGPEVYVMFGGDDGSSS